MTGTDRAEAVYRIIGLDLFLHTERGSGPYDLDEELREALLVLGVTAAEIDAALRRLGIA